MNIRKYRWFLKSKISVVKVLLSTNAIVDPLAMVVEAFHAFVTNEAMSCFWGADYFASRA